VHPSLHILRVKVIYMNIYIHICMYICIYTHPLRQSYIYRYIYICICVYIHIYMYIYTHIYIYMHVYIYVYMYTYIYVVYIYIFDAKDIILCTLPIFLGAVVHPSLHILCAKVFLRHGDVTGAMSIVLCAGSQGHALLAWALNQVDTLIYICVYIYLCVYMHVYYIYIS